MVSYLSKIMPNLPDIIVASQCLTPLDLERMFGMTRGDICHGRLEPDQLFSARPHPDAAQYATPVKGLYLCGSGTHPGGGVTGAPGRNAAKRILKAGWHATHLTRSAAGPMRSLISTGIFRNSKMTPQPKYSGHAPPVIGTRLRRRTGTACSKLK